MSKSVYWSDHFRRYVTGEDSARKVGRVKCAKCGENQPTKTCRAASRKNAATGKAIAAAEKRVVEAAMAVWAYEPYDEFGSIKPHAESDPDPVDLRIEEEDACAALAALGWKPQ